MIEVVLFGLVPELKPSPLLPTVTEPIVVAQPPPEPIVVIDPNNCEPAMYWAKESPHYCIPKPTQNRSDSVLQPSGTGTPVRARKTPTTSNTGNLYAPGNCTYYAKFRRPDLPNNLGNANTWTKRASSQGIPTGTTPRAGAIGQKGMHVVYVESVNADGTFNLSEWNYRNLYETTYRTVSAIGWSFIY